MATKKERIREADQIVDQNVAPVTAQPATPEEVAQAPVEVPAEQVTEPIIDEPVVDEPPVEVNPETIDMQVQIPTDQIAAAVAQATGDVVPAETAPDAVEAQQAEEAPMVAEETVPEGSVEAPVQQPVMESMEDGACTTEVMQESEEDEDVLDSIDIPEDGADLPDSYAPAEADTDIDDLFSEEPDDDELLDKIEDFVNSDDHSTEDVSDALRTSAAFLDQIADDKKFSFVDVVGEPEEDEIEEGPMTDNEEDLHESKKSHSRRMRESKRFNESIAMDANRVFVGDPIEVLSEDLFDEVCGDDIPADGVLKKDGKVIGLVAVSDNGGGDTKSEHTDYYYWLETGIIGVIDMKYAVDGADADECPRIVDVPSGKCKVTVQYDGEEEVYLEVKDAKTGEKLFWDDIDFDFNPDRYEDDDEDEDCYESRKNKQSKLRESNKPVSRKPVRLTSRPVVTERHSLKESSGIIYPAGSMPMGRSDEEDLVARQERVHEARRKAIREYRQKVVSQREPSRPVNNGRFNEALRDSVRSIKESADPKSWAANTFMDKYEESSKLNYKELLKNGFLG